MSRNLLQIALATAVALILPVSSAEAQNINASVGGTVTDPSGAVIPNAGVTLKSLATGTVSKGTTNESGLFRFPNLQAGAYELTVSAAGFRDFVQRGISLSINDTVNIKVPLEVGQAEQAIEVTADVSPLNTENAELKQAITPDTLEHVIQVAIQHCAMQRRIADQRESLEIFARAFIDEADHSAHAAFVRRRSAICKEGNGPVTAGYKRRPGRR